MNHPPLTCFSLTTTDQVAHLVLNRPEAMNTMHPTFWRELDQALTHINKAGEARAGDLQHRQAFQRRHGAGHLWRRRRHGRPEP